MASSHARNYQYYASNCACKFSTLVLVELISLGVVSIEDSRLLFELSVLAAATPVVIVAGIWIYSRLGAYLPTEQNRKLILALIVIDILFLILHIARLGIGWPAHNAFNIGVDWGYAEIYQYAKEFYIASALILIASQRRRATFVVWSVFFSFLLLDDSLQFHERLGTGIGRSLDIESFFGLDGHVVGEILASAAFGIVFLIPILSLTFLSRKNRIGDWEHASLFFLTICLVFFGVAIDALKNYVPNLEFIFDVVEDGGEMIVLSIVAWFVYVIRRNPNLVGNVERRNRVRSFR